MTPIAFMKRVESLTKRLNTTGREIDSYCIFYLEHLLTIIPFITKPFCDVLKNDACNAHASEFMNLIGTSDKIPYKYRKLIVLIDETLLRNIPESNIKQELLGENNIKYRLVGYVKSYPDHEYLVINNRIDTIKSLDNKNADMANVKEVVTIVVYEMIDDNI